MQQHQKSWWKRKWGPLTAWVWIVLFLSVGGGIGMVRNYNATGDPFHSATTAQIEATATAGAAVKGVTATANDTARATEAAGKQAQKTATAETKQAASATEAAGKQANAAAATATFVADDPAQMLADYDFGQTAPPGRVDSMRTTFQNYLNKCGYISKKEVAQHLIAVHRDKVKPRFGVGVLPFLFNMTDAVPSGEEADCITYIDVYVGFLTEGEAQPTNGAASANGRIPASSLAPASSAPALRGATAPNDHPPAADNSDNYADLTEPAGGWSEPSGKPVCSRFKTSDDATHYMREHNYRKLDGDSDGIACENLPLVGREVGGGTDVLPPSSISTLT